MRRVERRTEDCRPRKDVDCRTTFPPFYTEEAKIPTSSRQGYEPGCYCTAKTDSVNLIFVHMGDPTNARDGHMLAKARRDHESHAADAASQPHHVLHSTMLVEKARPMHALNVTCAVRNWVAPLFVQHQACTSRMQGACAVHKALRGIQSRRTRLPANGIWRHPIDS